MILDVGFRTPAFRFRISDIGFYTLDGMINEKLKIKIES